MNYMLAQNPATAINYQRQQAIAQQLMDNADQQAAPNEMASPGGYVINQNPMIMAGKALEKGLAGYLQGKNTAALTAAFQNNNAAPSQPALNASMSNGQGPTNGNDQNLKIAQQMQSGQPSADPTTVTGNPMGDMLLAQTNPERYKFMAAVKQAELAKTPEQKNAEYGTSNNTPAGNLVYGNAAKGAILPDQTYNGRTGVPIDMRTAQPLGGAPVAPQTAPTPSQSPAANPAPATATIPPIPSMANAPSFAAAPAGATAPPAPPSSMPNTSAAAPNTVSGFGTPLGTQAETTKTGENLADTQKTFNVTMSNLPRALTRFDELRKASADASSGYGIDEGGEGPKETFAQSSGGQFIEPKTALANQTIQQASKQGIIAELGPQLVGMRPNKFLESIATGASGLNAADPPATKINAINGLQDQYVGSLKSLANQIRGFGGNAPSEAEIDAAVAKAAPQTVQAQNGQAPALPAGATDSKMIKGVNYYKINGVWHQ